MLVAGLGASAGGLDAFKKFFAATPPDSGIAFVLVPHLDPAHESLMVDLLARHTAMPVLEAKDGLEVEPNRVYIIPPNKYMTISGGVLRLTGPVERFGAPTTIDFFLRSLAGDLRERAICIILSGTGAHGTLGLRAVKAAGGVTFVQDPATAEYERMPENAIATGLADYVMPVERMPEVLVQLVQRVRVSTAPGAETASENEYPLHQVLALMQALTKFDFRSYRKKMLLRRIERRMGLARIDSLPDYVTYLRKNPDELKLLVNDFLISVTSFFRDPEAFEELAKQVIAPLVQSKPVDGVIRVWVPGCATGEEAYSLVILLLEEIKAAEKHCELQVFATDIDQDALQTARQGLYPESISADVSQLRLARYFSHTDGSYQVGKQLRESLVFASQNLMADAPFSKMDLISCRNLLIYLESDIQKKVLKLLHFALNPSGYLFLGPSETIGRLTDLFEAVSKKWRVFRRIGTARAERVEFPIAIGTDARGSSRQGADSGAERPVNFADLTQRLVLEQLDAAAVLINRKYEILYYLGPTARYLDLPTGEPTHDLLILARDGLRTRLRAAVHKAFRDNHSIMLSGLRVNRDGEYHAIAVTVTPVPAPRSIEGLLLITFREESTAVAEPPVSPSEDSLIRQLEYELRVNKEDLQTNIEEMERTNEELKASNEEVMSMNEELQSANEELETSKEELQSLNEELTTVNNQLQDKVHELESANNDMANLLNCTNIATVFLDTSFRIKLFTPAATQLFSLIASDIGRPVGDIVKKVIDDNLFHDAQQLLRDLIPREKEVQTAEGRWCVRRIEPYRTADNRIDGVVITFFDITQRKWDADAVTRQLAAIVESSIDAVFSKDLDGTIRTWNRGAESLYGYTRDEMIGQSARQLVPEDRQQEWEMLMATLATGESVRQLETERVRKNGQRVPVSLTYSPIRDALGKVSCVSAIVRDISERRQSQHEVELRESRLQAILMTASDAIITIDHLGIMQSVNNSAERLFGYTAEEMLGQNVSLLMPSPYRERHDEYLRRYAETGEPHLIGTGREVRGLRKDGTTFPADLAVSRVDHLQLFTGIVRDSTRRKALEREIVEIASLEQRRIGSDLHDSVGQEITALSLLAKDLQESLLTPSVSQPLSEKMREGLRRCQLDLRAVLHGLVPVQIDDEGLMAALAELASRTHRDFKSTCLFECSAPVQIGDHLAATHLYYIAQEAVRNATKHAAADEILIKLNETEHHVLLTIQDNGTGMSARRRSHQGVGLQIMHNRASLIGAQLNITPAKPSGTLVSCQWLRTDDAHSKP